MPAWNHSQLGFPLKQGYSFEFTQKLKAFNVSGGGTRFREFDVFAPYIVTLQFNFSESQFIAFETFYKTTLNKGTLPFDITILTGVGFVQQVANFSDGYSYVKVGNDTRVSTKFLVKRDLSLVIDPLA